MRTTTQEGGTMITTKTKPAHEKLRRAGYTWTLRARDGTVIAEDAEFQTAIKAGRDHQRMAEEVTSWIITPDGTVEEVRRSASGNCVAAHAYGRAPDGMICYARVDRGEVWPQTYATKVAAWAAYDQIVAACEHDYQMTSHEEARCRRCRNIVCVPDV